MMESTIILAGDGHTATAAYRGLSTQGFVPELCTRDALLPRLVGVKRMFGDLATAVAALTPRLVVTAGYRPIVPADILERTTVLNVHHSLLPRYRGLHALVWAVLNGDDRVGFTLHEVDEFVDHGPIVWQGSIEAGTQTSWQLMETLDELIEHSLGWVVERYLAGELKPQAQDEGLATFVGRRHPADSRVDWACSATTMERRLRALVAPYPRPWFECDGERWEITRACVVHREYAEIPGHVVYRDAESVWIKLGVGLLRLHEVMGPAGPRAATDLFPVSGARLGSPATC